MKLPFSFSLKFVFRLLLPGFLAALSLVPVLHVALLQLNVRFPLEWAFLLLCVLLGWLFVLLDMPIYMAFEGRRYWPRTLKGYFLSKERKRMLRLESIVRESQATDRDQYLEASVELRHFPLDDDGAYTAYAPTRIGNLILSYEQYPSRAYGMDSVFYWPRIWLKLEDSQRREIDDQQAIADSAVYSTAALWFDGTVLLLLASYTLAGGHMPDLLPGTSTLAFLSAGCFLTGHFLYRIALQTQAGFGETFKAAFDGYRGSIDADVAAILDEIKEQWPAAVPEDARRRQHYHIAWRYLHNFRVRVGDELVVARREADRSPIRSARVRESISHGQRQGHEQPESKP